MTGLAAAVALGVAIVSALAAVLVALFRLVRASPEQRTADAAVWTSLRTGYDAQVAGFREDVASMRGEMGALRTKAEAGERAAREVAWLRGIVLATVGPLVDWIDEGAKPPPPHISGDLRALIAEAEQHASDPNTP